jgi:hypothetical protein
LSFDTTYFIANLTTFFIAFATTFFVPIHATISPTIWLSYGFPNQTPYYSTDNATIISSQCPTCGSAFIKADDTTDTPTVQSAVMSPNFSTDINTISLSIWIPDGFTYVDSD